MVSGGYYQFRLGNFEPIVWNWLFWESERLQESYCIGVSGNFTAFLCRDNLDSCLCHHRSSAFSEARVGWEWARGENFGDTGKCEVWGSTVLAGQLWMKMTWHSTTTRHVSVPCCTWRSTRPTWTWRCTSWRGCACKNMGGAISCPWRSVFACWF